MKTLLLAAIAVVSVMLTSCETLSLTPVGNAAVVAKARGWQGRHYQYGQGARCAAWVGAVMKSVGKKPPSGYYKCTNWLRWGTKSSVATIRPGDVVIYARSGRFNHIGIYLGGGRVAHRPTRYSKVGTVSLHYRRIIGVRRP